MKFGVLWRNSRAHTTNAGPASGLTYCLSGSRSTLMEIDLMDSHAKASLLVRIAIHSQRHPDRNIFLVPTISLSTVPALKMSTRMSTLPKTKACNVKVQPSKAACSLPARRACAMAATPRPAAACNTEAAAQPALSRRAALLAAGGAALLGPALLLQPQHALAAADPASVDWAAVRKDILDLISDPKAIGGIGDKGPTIVRLAWHSSGTYDKMSKTGGSGGGTIRFKEELAHGANAGLDIPVSWLEPIKAKHPDVSYADLYTLAGAVAIQAMGGPAIPWRAGRVDAMDPSAVTPDGRLPEADGGSPPKTAEGLRNVFYRMGFDDREIVALSGAHALGRCHAEASGYVGPWTPTPTIFSNLYFKLLLKTTWTPDARVKQFQFQDPTGTLMMLPSDIVLTQDAGFKQYVELYAKEKKTFYKDFAAAFSKLEELGTKGLVQVA